MCYNLHIIVNLIQFNNMKKLLKPDTEKKICLLLSVLLVFFFITGFERGENSAGGGGYSGDILNIWDNLNLFKKEIYLSIFDPKYDDSRLPLIYILHALFNPFIDTIDNFRKSVFFISLILLPLYFLFLRFKFKVSSWELILFFSLLITLSPFFRTSAFWALNENYVFLFILSSFFLLEKYFLNNNLKFKEEKLILIIIIFLSSLIVYFDQKMIIFPLLIYLRFIFSDIKIEIKILITLTYGIFSLPYAYLIYEWKSILPPNASDARMAGTKISIFNLGYCATIIAFYLTPFLIVKDNIFRSLKNKIINKNFFILLFFILLYILILDFNSFNNLPILGKGIVHKSLLIIEDPNYRYLITLTIFVISISLIYFYIDHFYDWAIILFFLMTSIFIYPFLQEYMDPLMIFIIILIFKTKFILNFFNSIFVFIYLLIFLLSTQYYYRLILFSA